MNAQCTAAFLKAHDNYLILTHIRPDGDTLGCGSALCLALRNLGKTAWMLESEDAISMFRGYLEGCIAPADFVPDTVVSVDTASEGMFPPNAEGYKGKVDFAIDHHGSNTHYAAQTWVEAERAACGEMIFELVEQLGVMDAEVAKRLYVAVSTDTGCFMYSNTTAYTHKVAAALMDQGIDVYPLNKVHFRTKTYKRFLLESAIVRDMELYQDGTIVVAPISLAMMDSIGATSEDSDDIASFLGQLEGALHSVTVKEKENGECKMSLRTDANYLNASAVCALLGGGGHAAAAGCSVKGTVREAIDAMLAAIETVQKG